MNNPPAFPCAEGRHIVEGMTLRDYFAAHALPEVIADDDTIDGAAREAYKYADAMLKEREKQV